MSPSKINRQLEMNMTSYDLRNRATQTESDVTYRERIGDYFEASSGRTSDKLDNFARFVPRQSMSVLLAKHELFKRILNVHGAIVECGVFAGGGLFSWGQFSAIHEPYNHGRRVIGFDTFCGFPSLAEEDGGPAGEGKDDHRRVGGYRFDGLEELCEGVELFDLNRPIGHIPKIELVPGDAVETVPGYIEENPHLVVALLYLDFDLYEPTLAALRAFLPRMPKGAVLAFDELNQKQWPGETLAVMREVGIGNLKIERFPFVPAMSFAVLD